MILIYRRFGEYQQNKIKRLEEERGYMPFFRVCPAGKSSTQEFGLKMVALLVGVICDSLGNSKEWILQPKETFQDLEKPLPSDREAFDGLYMIRKRRV